MPFDTIRMGSSAAGAYEIERSLRFNGADSTSLSFTPSSAGDLKKWTVSLWTKRAKIGAFQPLWGVGTAATGSSWGGFYWGTSDILVLFDAATSMQKESAGKFRDVSGWYHIVVAVDAVNTIARAWINGTEVVWGSQNTNPNNTNGNAMAANAHYIGNDSSSYDYDGYFAEVHTCDGLYLDHEDFGKTDPVTGAWIPKEYTGAHGTQGSYLNFSDNSNTTSGTLGDDDSANTNDWTPANFSVAAGVGNDSLLDSPTNNHATLTPLKGYGTTFTAPTNGNLDYSLGGTTNQIYSSTAVGPTGKWYVEITATSAASGRYMLQTPEHTAQWDQAFAVIPQSDVRVIKRGSSEIYSSITSISDGDIIGIALDCDNNTAQAYMNGTSLGNAFSLDSVAAEKIYHFSVARNSSGGGSPNGSVNFGQRAFSHQPSTDFKAWNTANLPEPTIKKGSDYFNAVLYEGTGSKIDYVSVGFQPDLTWIKNRSDADSHVLQDSVRGDYILYPDAPTDEGATGGGWIVEVADGFTADANGPINTDNEHFVAWCWKESATAGFDIVSYTGTGSATTISHSLGVKPEFILVKNRDVADGWQVQHKSKGATFTQQWDGAGIFEDTDSVWNDTEPTSSVFSVKDDDKSNADGEAYIAYLWSGVEGYSKFGSYTGNANPSGPFVFTGFRPAFILLKAVTAATHWNMFDTARDPHNQISRRILSNDPGEEVTNHSNYNFGIYSNGFIPETTSADKNATGVTFIYVAFAETPYKYANAR